MFKTGPSSFIKASPVVNPNSGLMTTVIMSGNTSYYFSITIFSPLISTLIV